MRKIEIEKPAEFIELAKKKKDQFLYYDHPSDGIDYFNDPKLEDIGWHACAFGFINYRVLAEFIENNCEGTLTFNDNEMGFNGFVEVDDIAKVADQLKEFVIDQIKNNKLQEYDEDQLEALEFFDIKL